MSISSRTGRIYSMNVIDDFSSFVWSIPLCSKGEATTLFKHWLAAIELQTPHRLKCLVTDNGELTSTQIQNFCAERGILHLFTAPYTSAHNGRAERLHRTIMDKARAMRIACAAPLNMWDEFCATAAYLTNFTATSANNGKTPYQLWHSKLPSLSHLREIGCRAYALIATHNPKVFHRSIPCILIGYAPDSKAYRLWDPTTDRIFNSYHVSFIEHRDLPHPPPSLSNPLSHSNPLSRSIPPLHLPPPPNTYPTNPQHIPSPTSNPPHPLLPQHRALPQDTNDHAINHQVTIFPQQTTIENNTINQQHETVNQHHSTSTIPLPTQLTIQSSTSVPLSSILPQPPLPDSRSPTSSHNSNTPPNTNVTNETNTVSQQNNTTTSSNTYANATPPNIVVHPPTTSLPSTSSSPPPPLTASTSASTSSRSPSRIPIPSSSSTLPRRSPRLAALQSSSLSGNSAAHLATNHIDSGDYTNAFLAEFTPLRDTHFLLPLELELSQSCSSVSEVLSALTVGATDLVLDPDDDPLWATAIASPEKEYWVAGARDELKSLKDLQVFVLVPRSDIPRGQWPLKGKLVCKQKWDDEGNISRYKVRYIAKGFAQRYLIDYNKTTAPTARLESFRALMHIAAVLDWDVQHFDIKTAFLHGVLPESETVFMEQPPGFEEPGKKDWVWRLQKSLYGMKQASRIWNLTFHKTMERLGFRRMINEWCVYRRSTPTGIIIFAVHVDDIITISSSQAENDRFKAELKEHWDISDLGAAKFALGISISRDRTTRSIHLSQTALIDHIVEQFGQSDAHPVVSPMVQGLQIQRPDPSVPVTSDLTSWMTKTPYRSLVGSLNYLAVATRPDIAFAVGRLATVLDCYRPDHWNAAIRVVRYLKGTRLFSLELGGTNQIRPMGFSDSDYANCPDTSRSVGGYCFTLGSGMISWTSHKQQHTADSSCYAEYIAIHNASHEVLFLRQFLEGLNMPIPDATPLYCDNDAARQLTEDHRWHAKIKHFRVHYHSSRDLVNNNEMIVLRVRSSDNVADILTKPLGPTDFARLRNYLGIRSPRSA